MLFVKTLRQVTDQERFFKRYIHVVTPAGGIARNVRAFGLEPFFIFFLGGQCFNRCIFCDTGRNKNPQYFPFAAYEQIVAAGQGIRYAILGGIEPTTYPQLFDLLSLLQSAGVEEIDCFGSGEMFASKDFLEDLLRYPVKTVSLPLYGDRETHNTIVGGDSYDAVVAALRNLKDQGVCVFLHSVILRRNLPGVRALHEFARTLGAPLAFLHPRFKPAPTPYTQLFPDYGELAAGLRQSGIHLISFPHCVTARISGAGAEWGGEGPSPLRPTWLAPSTFVFASLRGTKIQPCRTCPLWERCPGVPHSYLFHFQAEGISPMPSSVPSPLRGGKEGGRVRT